MRPGQRGFSLLELLLACALGLFVMAAAIGVLQRARREYVANESLASVQDAARQALAVLVQDIEHAGFYGFQGAGRVQLLRGGAVLAEGSALAQPAVEPVTAVVGLPAGTHDCGINFAVDLRRPVQGADNRFALGEAPRDCAPTASAGGAASNADTLTLRHASLDTVTPRAGRLQVYSTARSSLGWLQLFADGRAPGPVDALHEVRDLEVRSYYVARHSVGRPGWPALRVKYLTESRGAVQFRDDEIMPGVEDLQVEYGVARGSGESRELRFVDASSARLTTEAVVAVRIWLRVRADVTESGFADERRLAYANTAFMPTGAAVAQRRIVVSRTVEVRTPPPSPPAPPPA